MGVRDSRTTKTPSTDFELTGTDGLNVTCARWDSWRPVRGLVQIAHGMGEHVGRYLDVIEVMVSAGLTVYGNDHRGHGRTALAVGRFGDFGEGGFDLLVEDMTRLTKIARGEHPGRPIVLLAHSMGSFAAQQFILDHSDEIDGLILSGTGALDGLARLAGDSPAGLSVLNARFEPARTPFDWLSRDTSVVDRFIADPLCFAELEPDALASFLGAAPRLADPLALRGIRDDLPIYLLSGSEDPVGQQLEGVRVLISRYQGAGLLNVFREFYPGGRHEMLNELNRGEVLARLLSWINAVFERKGAWPAPLRRPDHASRETRRPS